MVRVLERLLGGVRTRTDRLGLIPHERSGGVGVVPVSVSSTLRMGSLQLGSVVINTGNEERNTEWSGHEGLVVVDTLSEAEREVTHRLRARLDTDLLVVRELVHLRGDAGVVDHRARVRRQARHRAANVPVDLHDLFDRGRLEQGRLHTLLDTENNTVRSRDTDGRGTELASALSERLPYLDRLHGVLDWTLVRRHVVSYPPWKRRPCYVS